MGSIFKAPLGGAILAAEILYLRDFKYDTLLPAFVSSLTGYAIFGLFEGFEPLFSTADMSWTAVQLPFFLLLGILSAGIGYLYIKTFYGTKAVFDAAEKKYRIPKFLKPAIGAGILGVLIIILAYLSPTTLIAGVGCLGTGYGFVQLALYNLLPFTVLLILPFLKILATALTIGSGASGGVFAPGLAVGGFLGGALGSGLHLLLPEIVGTTSIPVFVIIGMIAVFGGVSHAPAAVLLMVLEMTGSFVLAIPAVLAVTATSILLKDHTIFQEQRISRKKNWKPNEE